MIACLTTPGLIAALANLLGWSVMVSVVAFLVAVVVASNLGWFGRSWSAASFPAKTVVMAALVASILWTIAMTQAPRVTVLALRGEPVVARIVDYDITHNPRADEHCYTLQRTDSTPIFGDLCRNSDEFSVDDTITVLVDPSGLIAPETPDQVAGARFSQVIGLVSLVATLALGWISGGLTPPAANGHPVPQRPRRRP